MSGTRQDERFLIRASALTFRDGHHIERHSHSWGQLIFAASGTMRVGAEEAVWLVPPTQAIWAPPGVAHEIRMRGQTAMRTLYVSAAAAEGLPGACRAIEVTPLLRELILHIVGRQMLREDAPEDARLCAVLLDLLRESRTTPLGLTLPRDRRARRLAERLLADPCAGATLGGLATEAAASLRTLQRLFARETGLSIEAWRTKARLQHGLVSLTDGASVTAAALEAGYASPSAFIAAFKKAFGVTPARYGPLPRAAQYLGSRRSR